jgi:hypothetical protein
MTFSVTSRSRMRNAYQPEECLTSAAVVSEGREKAAANEHAFFHVRLARIEAGWVGEDGMKNASPE